MSYAAPAPEYWTDDLADCDDSGLSADQCVIKGEWFFVHGLIEIPVVDSDEPFSWGVWVSLSKESYDRMAELWEAPGSPGANRRGAAAARYVRTLRT